nr:Hsp20 family protein [Paraburkholderia sacchari]
MQDGSLSIEAEAVIPAPSGLRLQHGELRHPHFWCAFTLSPDFDVSRIDAQVGDGVLKLTIPRREEAKPRRIEVSVGEAGRPFDEQLNPGAQILSSFPHSFVQLATTV